MKKQFFLLIFSLYLLLAKGMYGNFETADEISNRSWVWGFDGAHAVSSYSTILSLVQKGSIDISADLALISSPDVGFLNGNYYSLFPPGVAIIALPLYLLGYKFNLGQMFAYTTPIFFSIITLLLTLSVSKKVFNLSKERSVLAAFILGFASFFFAYSNTLFQHSFTTAIGIGLFYLCYKFKRKPSYKDAILIGALYGISGFFDYPNLILFAPYILYLLVLSVSNKSSFKKLTVVIGICISIISIHAIYNYTVFGNPLQLSNALPLYDGSNDKYLIDNSSKIAEIKRNITGHLDPLNIPTGLYVFFLSPGNGILWFSPILIFAIIGFRKTFSVQPQESSLIFVLITVNVGLYACFGAPSGGWAYGVRYLIPSLPLISILVANGLKTISIKNLLIFSSTLFISIAHSLATVMSSVVIPIKDNLSWFQVTHFEYVSNNLTSSFIYNNLLKYCFSLSMIYLFLLIIICSFAIQIIEAIAKNNE